MCVSERDWRDKQKAAESLKETIEKQRADLDRVRREIGEKEMLCTALRVRERERRENVREREKDDGEMYIENETMRARETR